MFFVKRVWSNRRRLEEEGTCPRPCGGGLVMLVNPRHLLLQMVLPASLPPPGSWRITMLLTDAGSVMLGTAGLGSYGWIRARTCHRAWTARRWDPELGGKAMVTRKKKKKHPLAPSL